MREQLRAWMHRQPLLTFLLGTLLVVGAIGLVVGAARGQLHMPASQPAAVDDSQVMDVCHSRANDLLPAPSTSDFGGDSIMQTGYGNTYVDDGYVDSENVFGAKIRRTYTCTAIHKGGDNFSVRVVLH